jgi:hypothetical protein
VSSFESIISTQYKHLDNLRAYLLKLKRLSSTLFIHYILTLRDVRGNSSLKTTEVAKTESLQPNWRLNMDLIKVSANSRTSAVAGAISGVVRQHHRAEVQSIGLGAVNQGMKALQQAVERLHHCRVVYRGKTRVSEILKADLVWDGDVYIFALKSHRLAKLAYAWSVPMDDSNQTRYYIFLHRQAIHSAWDAVRAAILSDYPGR